MRRDLVKMTQRVSRLRAHAAEDAPSETLLSMIDDLLTEGYAHALAADAWSMRAEQRLHELISGPPVAARGDRLRSLSHAQTSCQRDLMALRRELAALRLDRDRLHARSPRPRLMDRYR